LELYIHSVEAHVVIVEGICTCLSMRGGGRGRDSSIRAYRADLNAKYQSLGNLGGRNDHLFLQEFQGADNIEILGSLDRQGCFDFRFETVIEPHGEIHGVLVLGIGFKLIHHF
jgi:hypothetical protein